MGSRTHLNRGNFNPRPPRGERHARRHPAVKKEKFQSTPSARRATLFTIFCASSSMDFNPRPPRGERPAFIRLLHTSMLISIHALREESDLFNKLTGGLTYISIHALREESDRRQLLPGPPEGNFNPRPPRGERLPTVTEPVGVKRFQSTPSARRATMAHQQAGH